VNYNNRSKVAIIKCRDYDPELVLKSIRKAIDLIGGIQKFVKRGENILLKPNCLAPDPPETGTTTHPIVFEATAKILLDHGINVCYGDSPSFHDPLKVMKKIGIYQKAVNLNLKLADFKSYERVYFDEGIQNRVFDIAKGVLDADGLISLPRLKTHGLTLLTGAIKNQFGCIPGTKKSAFHVKLSEVDKFSQMLVDLTILLKPRFYIMDGIKAMEGNGPRRGNLIKLGVLLLSSDPVALDAVASRIIGLDPYRVPTSVKGMESGLGNIESIEIVGTSINELKKKLKLPTNNGNINAVPKFIRNIFKNTLIPRPVINYKRCVKCYECHKVCPTNPKSLYIDNDRYPKYNYESCIRCYCCQENCPEGAITIKRKLF